MQNSYSDMKVADNLRACRAKRRLTQQDVADAIGVNVASVANWEAGKCGMSLESACKLADLFDCSIGELSGRDESGLTA